MPAALTSQSIVGIIFETTRGTKPTSGAYEAVPILEGGGSEFDPSVKQANTFQIIDGTRMKSTVVGGAFSVRARLNCPLSYEVGSQSLLRAALHSGAWAGGVITANANATYFFSLVVKMELGATDDFIFLSGCEVASATFDFPLNGACTVQYEIIGTTQSVATAMPGTATLGALAGLNPFATGLTGADLTWGGVGSNIGSASFTLNNQVAPKYAWGGSGADHVVNGNLIAQGRFEKYYYNDDIIVDAIAETVRTLNVTVKSSDGSNNTMVISFPDAKITSAPVADSAGSWTQNAEFTGQYDTGISSILNITVT